MTNRLFYGDNLDVLREHVPSQSVDLIYLDPPFNSNRNYNVIFGRNPDRTHGTNAQIQAFGDTWAWTPATAEQYAEMLSGSVPGRIADVLAALRALIGENDAMAYLVNMAPRLVELHRVLKPTGSLYLHCDPTMSHYLKIILDTIFGPENFRNEIIWERTGSKGYATRRLSSNHDVILGFQKSDKATWNQSAIFQAYDLENLDAKTAGKYSHVDADGRRYRLDNLTGPNDPRPNLTYEVMGVTRRWRWSKDRMDQAIRDGVVVQTKPGSVPQRKSYLDEMRGRPLDDVWGDIPPINSQASERLGYPTQKPVALLERIIAMSGHEGDVVLDPFCGCGTTIDAAQRLGRTWVGIDVTYIAVDLIEKRLLHTFGASVSDTYEVLGIPRDLDGARRLFEQSPFDFERWAVSRVNGTPNEKQVGDKGVDGVVRFFTDTKGSTGRVLVSVKGGKTIGPQFVRDLLGTVQTQRAEMGSLITLSPFTRGMKDAIDHAGTYHWPINGHPFPRAQIRTIEDLLGGHKLNAPPSLLPYIPADRHAVDYAQLALL